MEVLAADYEFLRSWSFDRLGQPELQVTVQVPENDGVNYLFKYFRQPMSDFVQRTQSGEHVYIRARKIMREGGHRSDKDGPGKLAAELRIPALIYSRGQTIGVNVFVHNDDQAIHKQEPLRTYWIKDNITLLPINLFMRTKALAFKALRKIFPKREHNPVKS